MEDLPQKDEVASLEPKQIGARDRKAGHKQRGFAQWFSRAEIAHAHDSLPSDIASVGERMSGVMGVSGPERGQMEILAQFFDLSGGADGELILPEPYFENGEKYFEDAFRSFSHEEGSAAFSLECPAPMISRATPGEVWDWIRACKKAWEGYDAEIQKRKKSAEGDLAGA